MAENTIADQVWSYLLRKYGKSVKEEYDPLTVEKMTREYRAKMYELGFCPDCESKIDNYNAHGPGICDSSIDQPKIERSIDDKENYLGAG